MKKPNFRKTPIALAVSSLLFTSVNVQADSPDNWGRWFGGGGNPQAGGNFGELWDHILQTSTTNEALVEILVRLAEQGIVLGDGVDLDFPLTLAPGLTPVDVQTFLAGGMTLDALLGLITPPAADLTDPPPGQWAFYGAEGSRDTYYILEDLYGNTATGTLTLTSGDPTNPGYVVGGAEGGTIALDATDPFLPFYGDGPDGFIVGFEEGLDLATGEFEYGGEEEIFFIEEGPGGNFGNFVAGQPTPLADMAALAGASNPVVGAYFGESWELGYATMIGVDFTAGTWGGGFYGGEGFDFSASGTFVGTTATSNRLSSPELSVTALDGAVNFSFFGPGGEVIGGNFDVTAEQFGGSYYERVTDVFIAVGEELIPRDELPGPIDQIVHEIPN
jgi:hypothetical protein